MITSILAAVIVIYLLMGYVEFLTENPDVGVVKGFKGYIFGLIGKLVKVFKTLKRKD